MCMCAGRWMHVHACGWMDEKVCVCVCAPSTLYVAPPLPARCSEHTRSRISRACTPMLGSGGGA